MEGFKYEKKNELGKETVIAELIEMYNIKTAAVLQNALKDLLGNTLQEMIDAELDEDLGYERHEQKPVGSTNYRNGYKPKRLKPTMSELEIEVPQERKSEFELKVVPKHKLDISETEQRIINMYARGYRHGVSTPR